MGLPQPVPPKLPGCPPLNCLYYGQRHPDSELQGHGCLLIRASPMLVLITDIFTMTSPRASFEANAINVERGNLIGKLGSDQINKINVNPHRELVRL